MFRGSLIAGLAALAVTVPSAPGAASNSPRILYLGDWSGHWTLYAADPAGEKPPAQITFADDVAEPVPSPDGRRIAFLATSAPCRIVVAKPDGSDRRTVARARSSCFGSRDLSWSSDSKRLLYSYDDAIYVVGVDGKHRRLIGTGTAAAWSPNGRSVAFLSESEEVFVRTGQNLVAVVSDAQEFAWSPTGRWIAAGHTDYSAPSTSRVVVVQPDARGLRTVSRGFSHGLAWSHDARFLAFSKGGGLEVVDVAKDSRRDLAAQYGSGYAWSPKSDLFAFDTNDGFELLDAIQGTTTQLSSDHGSQPSWSADGRSIAYVDRLDLPDFREGDLKIVDLSGTVRTVVDASSTAGGQIELSGWIKPRGTLHYRPPQPRSMPTATARELVSPWKIERIATDGGRIAYVSCGHIFLWTPATGELRQAEPAASLHAFCRQPNDPTAFEPFQIYDLTLAGDRLAFGTRIGNSAQAFRLYEEHLSPAPTPHVVIEAGGYAGCGVTDGGLGELAGSADMIVFSRWHEVNLQSSPGCAVRTTSQEIRRLDPGGCPCPALASSPGPLVPADVDEGRILAFGDNQTLLLDRTGTPLLSIPVSPTAAQLDGSDLVLVRRGALLHYDARTGALLHTWVLPDVPSAGMCGSPHPWTCTASLILLDLRRGFATYSIAGQVHVIRLADGHDVPVGAGTTARFFDGGLAYADGPRIHVVPFETLALR